MATFNYIDLRIPEARLVADLSGIEWDLQRTREHARLLISELGSSSPNWQLVEPLSIAIAVTYSRAFISGIRHSLGESDLTVLSQAQRNVHDYIRNLRDKHIAHSVNVFEENFVRAYYCEERVYEEGFTSIGSGGGRIAGLSSAEAHAIVELITVLEAYVEQRIAGEKETLLATVRTLPIDEVLSGGQSVFNPANTDVVKRRKR